MRYFDDIELITGGVHPRYAIHLDQRPDVASLEFCSAGGLYHQRGDGPRQALAGPAVFWHQPGVRYRYGPLASPGWWYHHFVLFRGPRAQRILGDALDPLSVHGSVVLAEAGDLHRLFVDLVGLVQGVRRRQPEAVTVLERILATLAGAIAAPEIGPRFAAIEAVAAAVAERPLLAWDWTAEASRLGLSEAHFRRVFRDVVGVPPQRHLLRQRMLLAGERLLSDRRPVRAVAGDLGFADQAVFTRRFARIHGLTPRRWRATHPLPPG